MRSFHRRCENEPKCMMFILKYPWIEKIQFLAFITNSYTLKRGEDNKSYYSLGRQSAIRRASICQRRDNFKILKI